MILYTILSFMTMLHMAASTIPQEGQKEYTLASYSTSESKGTDEQPESGKVSADGEREASTSFAAFLKEASESGMYLSHLFS